MLVTLVTVCLTTLVVASKKALEGNGWQHARFDSWITGIRYINSMLGVLSVLTVYAPFMCKDHPFVDKHMAARSSEVVRLEVFF